MASGETTSGNNKELTVEDPQRNVQATDLHCMKHCDACKYDDCIEEAVGFCVSCTEYLCQTCCRDHRKNKLTRNHSLLKDEEMPEDVELFRKLNELTKCTIHPENDIAYECAGHKADTCVVCLSETHRKCGKIRDFALDTEQVDTNAKLFDENDGRLTKINQKTEKIEQQIVRDENDFKKELKAFRDQLKRQVDALTEKLLAEVKGTIESENKKMSNTKQECAEIQTKVQKGKLLLEVALKYGTTRQYAVVSKHLHKLNQTISEDIETIMTKPIQRVSLEKDNALLSQESIGEVTYAPFTIKSFVDEDNGSDVLSDKEDKIRENEASALHASSLTKEVQERKVSMEKPKSNTPLKSRKFVQHSTCHGIRTSSDESECTVAAIEMLANGNIIVADTNNLKVKLFTGQFDFLDERAIPGNPIDMCVSDNQVYLCCSDVKKIFRLEFDGDTFSPEVRFFDTRLQPISVSKIDSNVFVLFSSAAYNGNEAGVVNIEIRKGSGAVVSQITYVSSAEQFHYVEDAKRIHIMPSSDFFLAENNRISCYKVNQSVNKLSSREWYYKSYCLNILSKARGMSMDSEGNVYVCGMGSYNVHQVSSKNYLENRVIVTKIREPISVLVDEKNDRLLVGCENDDNVHTFSMI